MNITIGHTPDADDAFMFAGLARGKIDTGSLTVRLILEDIETLNRRALEGSIEVTALSFHAYARVHRTYALLPCGASIGMGHGPILVAKTRRSLASVTQGPIAVPGEMTTAFLLLKIFLGDVPYTVVPFDRIPEEVTAGRCAAGLLIHEGQLTYKELGLVKLMDLGVRWNRATRLPLPLGGNGVRKDLGPDVIEMISLILRESIQWGMEHHDEAMASAMEYSRGARQSLVDAFVRMYVNMYTLSYGTRGKKAVKTLLAMGWKKGALPELVDPEYLPADG